MEMILKQYEIHLVETGVVIKAIMILTEKKELAQADVEIEFTKQIA